MSLVERGHSIEFLWNTHSYINEYIKFADAKAGVVATWTSAFLGVLISIDVHHLFMGGEGSDCSTLTGIAAAALSLIGMLLLAAGFIAAVFALIPRLWSRPLRSLRFWKEISPSPASQNLGYIFWSDILAHGSTEAFVKNVLKRDDDRLAKDIAEHIYVLSQICDRKFSFVVRSIQFSTAGSICAAIVTILFK